MAEKQFARNDADNFAGLAEDDPLSELARIVGYDARPAVETLKELKRHQETVKIDPPFNLEDELLREFDRYAGSQDAAPAPVVADVAPAPAEIAVRPPVVESADDGVGAASAPTSAMGASFVDAAPAPVFAHSERDAFEAPAPAADDAAHLFDLADELEFSMRAETAAAAPSDDEPVFNAPAFDMSVFDDIALDEPDEAVVPQPETVRREAPVAAQPVERLEPSFDQPLSFTAARPEVVVPPSPAAVAAEPEMSEVDKLLADVARFPVPPVAPRAAEPVLPVQESGTPAKKQNYPFTPVFSRATPVAGSSGSRSYATPAMAEPAVAVPQTAPVSAPVVAAAAAIPAVAAAPVAVAASEPEPDFDLANFERELSDIQFDMDLFDEPQAATGGPVVDQIFATQPEPVYAAPQRQAAAPEPVREPELAAIEEPVEEALPFDPAMIAETEEHPSAISEMDVPALPVHEEPQSVVPLHADFDLDLDAEMAQLFAEHQPTTVETPTPVAKASAAADVAEMFNMFSRQSAPSVVSDFQVDEDVRRAFEAQRAEFGAAPHRVDAFNFEAYDNVSPAAESGQRSRLPVYAAAAAVLLLLGGAGLYVWMGGSDAALTAEGPKVILADKDPVKIVPEEKGGKTVPNQDKAVYDRVAGTQDSTPRQEALVSTKEEPLDVVQRTLTPETLPLPDEEDGAAAPADTTADAAENRLLPEGQEAAAAAKDEQNPAVAPRKVRTMIVKPDGTLVAREEPVSEPVATATTTLPAATETVPAATASDVALAAPTTTTTTTVPVTPATTEPATATEAAATPAVDTPANTPVPQMRPAEQPVNVVGTVTESGNLRPTASPETQVAAATPSQTAATQPVSSATAEAAATTVAPGTYVIQIASVPNEADAQKTFTSLSSKFGSVIGGRGVDIKRADIAGKGTFYRVRIPAGSKEEANQLCARYKSAGGSCLVTR